MFLVIRKSLIAAFTLIVALLGVILGGAPVLAEPVIYRVAPTGAVSGTCGGDWSNPCDLQYALTTLASAGSELWVQQGTYKPGDDRTSSFILKDQVAIYGGFAGTETSRDARDPSIHVTILSGDLGVAGDSSDNSYHVVLANSTNGSALLDGFIITAGNGNGDASAQNNWGGGILVTNDSSPDLRNLVLRENSAGIGGGLSMWGNPTLTNVEFRKNSADLYGGGMYMYHGSAPSLNHVTFDHNSAGSGGGGLFTDEASYPTLMNLTFSHNSAPFGGGMSSGHGDITVTNATFYGNTADDGGAIFNASYGTLYLWNVTISGNTGTSMGGVSSTSFSSTLTINNSIIYGNSGGNLDGAEDVTYSIVQGGYPGTSNLDLDPLLGALQNNGGFTQTMALGAGSPAINAGDAANCPPVDQRGIPRPQGTRCDIGAYEYPFPLSPTSIIPTFLPSTPTSTPSRTPSPTPTPSASASATNTATATRTPTRTPTYDPTIMAAGSIMRVSIGLDRVQGNNDSYFPAISADGRYIVFNSRASNLVPGDTNGMSDIFIHDMHTRQTMRVSVDSNGIQGNGDSYRPVVTADGRYIAFDSNASNLVDGDTNGVGDVFVHDRQTGVTVRVSVHSTGTQGNVTSLWPSISANGRYIAFFSSASDLVANDTNAAGDVFLHDRQTGETRRISEAYNGVQANNDSNFPSISADGRYVAFESVATNLIPGDTNGVIDIFRYDSLTGQILRVSVSSYEEQANRSSNYPSISADGSYIAFQSEATNLVSGDTNAAQDIFLHDTWTGITARVSVDSNGLQGNNTSLSASVSADGRYIAFDSYSSNLVSGDSNAKRDVFVYDRAWHKTTRISVNYTGVEGNDESGEIVVSANGQLLAFTSRATNLVPWDKTDTNVADVFVYRQAVSIPPTFSPSTPTPTPTRTPSPTPTPSASASPTNTATATRTPTFTATVTASPTPTPTRTPAIPPVYHAQTTTGVFRPSNGALYLKNRNETGFADVQINYGIGGDYPVVGDWDGDGVDTIGVYRNGQFYLRNENSIGFADIVFPFGQPGDQPVAGDWNGDGIDTIGVYRNGTFFLRNTNDAGNPDRIFGLGVPGDVGIAGDWDGDGKDSTGVFRPSNGALYLKHKNETGFADIQIHYGIGGDKPVTGDWDGDGVDTIGVYRNGSFYLRNSNSIGFADIVFALGIPGDHPIAGDWDGIP